MSVCVLIRTRAVDEHLSSPSKEGEEGGDGGGGSNAGHAGGCWLENCKVIMKLKL